MAPIFPCCFCMDALLDVDAAAETPSHGRILEDCQKFENTVEVGRASPKGGAPRRAKRQDQSQYFNCLEYLLDSFT
jgi:hypothetical protein